MSDLLDIPATWQTHDVFVKLAECIRDLTTNNFFFLKKTNDFHQINKYILCSTYLCGFMSNFHKKSRMVSNKGGMILAKRIHNHTKVLSNRYFDWFFSYSVKILCILKFDVTAQHKVLKSPCRNSVTVSWEISKKSLLCVMWIGNILKTLIFYMPLAFKGHFIAKKLFWIMERYRNW